MDLADLANLTSGISSAVPQTLNLGLAFRRALMDEELHKQGLADKRFTRGLQAVELAGKYPEYADLLPTIAGETGQAPMGGMNLPTPEAPTVAPPTATAIPTEPPAGRAPEPIETPTTPGLAGPTMAMPGTPPPAPPEPVTGLPPTPAAGPWSLLAARAKMAQDARQAIGAFRQTGDFNALVKQMNADPARTSLYLLELGKDKTANDLFKQKSQEIQDSRLLNEWDQGDVAAYKAANPGATTNQARMATMSVGPNAARRAELAKRLDLLRGAQNDEQLKIERDSQTAGQLVQQYLASGGQMNADQLAAGLATLHPSVITSVTNMFPSLQGALAQARGAGTERGKVLAGEESVPGVPGQTVTGLRAAQEGRVAAAKVTPEERARLGLERRRVALSESTLPTKTLADGTVVTIGRDGVARPVTDARTGQPAQGQLSLGGNVSITGEDGKRYLAKVVPDPDNPDGPPIVQRIMENGQPALAGSQPKADEFAALYKQIGINPRGLTVAQPAPSPAPQTFKGLPPPAQFKDRTIRNPATGQRLRSNGTTWEPVP